ncbi:MAG TPA: DUF4386 family protein [Thermoplasmata archaeon]
MSIPMVGNRRGLAIAGTLAGVALIGEFVFFGLSGFPGSGFNDPAVALPYLEKGGALLRVAVLFGASGVGLWTVFAIGLAARLQQRTPGRALASLYLTLLGNAGDGLVALTFFVGSTIFSQLASADPAAAVSAWPAFAAVTAGFQVFGNFFLGLSLLAAGSAMWSSKALSRALGALGIVTGIVTLTGVLAVATAYLVAILLAVVFRLWAGVALLRSEVPQEASVQR